MYANIELLDGKIIKRKIKSFPLGNFFINIVRIQNKEYILGNGDEYLRGYEPIYKFEDLKSSDVSIIVNKKLR